MADDEGWRSPVLMISHISPSIQLCLDDSGFFVNNFQMLVNIPSGSFSDIKNSVMSVYDKVCYQATF
jgi:hypothetical protein